MRLRRKSPSRSGIQPTPTTPARPKPAPYVFPNPIPEIGDRCDLKLYKIDELIIGARCRVIIGSCYFWDKDGTTYDNFRAVEGWQKSIVFSPITSTAAEDLGVYE